MALSTDVNDKRSKIAKLREKHQPVFEALGIKETVVFIPKMAYTPPGKDEKHIGFFPSELKKGTDIYTEFVSREFDSEDPERTLYKWRYNAHWESEYEEAPSKTGDTSGTRYLVPVSELVKVEISGMEKNITTVSQQLDLNIADPETDPPYSSMTLRDYAAIQLRVPMSGKPWLNDMITESSKK